MTIGKFDLGFDTGALVTVVLLIIFGDLALVWLLYPITLFIWDAFLFYWRKA